MPEIVVREVLKLLSEKGQTLAPAGQEQLRQNVRGSLPAAPWGPAEIMTALEKCLEPIYRSDGIHQANKMFCALTGAALFEMLQYASAQTADYRRDLKTATELRKRAQARAAASAAALEKAKSLNRKFGGWEAGWKDGSVTYAIARSAMSYWLEYTHDCSNGKDQFRLRLPLELRNRNGASEAQIIIGHMLTHRVTLLHERETSASFLAAFVPENNSEPILRALVKPSTAVEIRVGRKVWAIPTTASDKAVPYARSICSRVMR